ncbi:heavy metal-associated isoprenylated plant protein 19-like [Andrographis paniculata]|uniref:heavy metal-associated isoprenylated plant protein 19-like n=1 Tax=Andrographis paniculata TaxID=175694 RepID=UPI0021E8507C|nr:heavy metal-associated isoprenylated plant protein 19-like [Andrographis paniculata]
MNSTENIVVSEYNVPMHCNACERTVAKTISKIKGVEKFVTDMNHNKVVVTGRFDPQKVLKRLKKKRGKKVELVEKQDDDEKGKNVNGADSSLDRYFYGESEMHMMFNDENANACSIM